MLLNEKSELICRNTVHTSVNRVVADGNSVFVLENSGISCYNQNLEKQYEVAVAEEYSSFIKIGGDVYLLSFDSVQKQELR